MRQFPRVFFIPTLNEFAACLEGKLGGGGGLRKFKNPKIHYWTQFKREFLIASPRSIRSLRNYILLCGSWKTCNASKLIQRFSEILTSISVCLPEGSYCCRRWGSKFGFMYLETCVIFSYTFPEYWKRMTHFHAPYKRRCIPKRKHV